ncbi:MAG: hypothetical protein K0U72_09740 [Gammaproteobacteria bacterium]|nr:hypothetical protein [Gammaproteobacteria bacterium]
MTATEISRLLFACRFRTDVPADIKAKLAIAIENYFEDPLARTLDYWLALPPRPIAPSNLFARRRSELYIAYAATLDGSNHSKAMTIETAVEIWLDGQSPASQMGDKFTQFIREFREIEAPHIRSSKIRELLRSESCQRLATEFRAPGV